MSIITEANIHIKNDDNKEDKETHSCIWRISIRALGKYSSTNSTAATTLYCFIFFITE